MANQKMRIKIKAYDHKLLDESAASIIAAVQRTRDLSRFLQRRRSLRS